MNKLLPAQEKEKQKNVSNEKKPLGLYLHVPFCASTCDFCAFYQEKPKREDIDLYLHHIELELQHLNLARPIDTIFWGGGTPGLLPTKDLVHLTELIKRYCNCSQLLEWSIEMAPSTVKLDKIIALKESGITRISMGVQSFQDELLQQLGRLHRPNQIFQAYEIFQKAEFPNINLDLIFAIPNQTMDHWLRDLQQAIDLHPQHLSTYCLTFEEDTALYVKLSKGKVNINLDLEADLYLKTWDFLESQGYNQYEISNFARPGYPCLHNLNTWHMHEWIGIGPSASSQYQNKRFTHPHSLTDWQKGVQSYPHPNPYLKDIIELNNFILGIDAIVFGLRLNQGINLSEIESRFPGPTYSKLLPTLQDWHTQGLVEFNYPYLRLTSSGRLLTDELGIQCMQLLE